MKQTLLKKKIGLQFLTMISRANRTGKLKQTYKKKHGLIHF